MLCAAWPQIEGSLASTRRVAELFLEGFHGNYGALTRPSWIARWTGLAENHCVVAASNVQGGASEQAIEAWLCALTAFEVARRLADDSVPENANVSAKVDASMQTFTPLLHELERVRIVGCEQGEFHSYYLSAARPGLCAPAVICISNEDETEATLLARLLPVVIGRSTSILVVAHSSISNDWPGQSELILSCCFDYLSARPDVDATRIGVYGEGWSAVLATNFALAERRVAAAVCDGGLWNWARTQAFNDWMMNATSAIDESTLSRRRSRLARQLKCPVLVVAGGRGMVSVPEAIKLEADCAEAGVDLELAMPRMTRTSVGEFENFVAADECIFEWLGRKLTRRSAL
ncbi:pimeloyl-ACP methyl ester carboxylesterase [Bradyrhizobium yuanmingense]|uniref:alpha/beta hydrolase family protein n=1 Tax=Bradyrhizobium yuanmingense TaxID=108015 RepID=UPI00351552AE